MNILKSIALVILLLSGCKTAPSNSAAQADEEIILKWRVTQVSTEDLEEKFGDWSDWKQFKSKIKPGDEIWLFSTPEEDWKRRMGWEGYALFRDGKVIRILTTKIS